jgi:hypothetical protein
MPAIPGMVSRGKVLRGPTTFPSASQVLRVSSTGLCDYTDIVPKSANVHYVEPGDDAQAIVDAATAGDVIYFMPGLHDLPLQANFACVYITKQLYIYLSAGCTVRCQDTQAGLLQVTPPEITQGTGGVEVWPWYAGYPKLNDLLARPATTVTGLVNKRVKISSAGTPDAFQVGTTTDVTALVPAPSGSATNITGGWQDIGDGIEIKFNATTGHTVGDEWYLGTTGEPVWVFRIGDGTQVTPIEGVVIFGPGKIDGNQTNQVITNILAADISACICIDGRVNDTRILGVELVNSERPVMAFGRNDGTFYLYGETDGEDFNVNNLVIDGIHAHDCQKAVLWGHPAKRGRQNGMILRNSRVFVIDEPAVEPNFRCQGFMITNNEFECQTGGKVIHLWRGGSYGIIADNIVYDNSTATFVDTTTPPGWPTATDITQENNINVETEQTSFVWVPNTYKDTVLASSVAPNTHLTLDFDILTDEKGVLTSTNSGCQFGQLPLVGGGKSILFDTNSDYIQCSGAATDPTFLEVWLWANLDFGLMSTCTLWSHRDSTNALIQLTCQSSTELRLQWRNTGGGAVNSLNATSLTLNGVTNFYCFRWTNGSQKLWVNNVEVASATNAVSGSYAATFRRIGNSFGSTIAAFGRIDEVTTFTSAPSDADRLAAYNAGT